MDYRFWTIGLLVGAIVGFSKSGMPGLGVIAVPLLILLFDAKAAVGVITPICICGDIMSLIRYRRHADWSTLWRLLPGILIGMVIGGFVFLHINSPTLRPLLGILILLLVVLQVVTSKLKMEDVSNHPAVGWGLGGAAGFATTVGNLAGPIMSIYLLAIRFSKEKFIGTGSWYYFTVNCMKVPLYVFAGEITFETLRFNACVVPGIIGGALLGWWLMPYIPRRIFDHTVLVLAAVSGVWLLLG
ncbi:MAG: sulfite exporter TauE/SafE family protein [Lentisphaeria bacterium]|jgi:hypothetical protein|nr:sulfite exporter TauE/SafE family protein [Lentisphaeria bacterium]MDP7740150.1 sulfite exporter TauE/SafE family protein [Lentisphaeria bacterium]